MLLRYSSPFRPLACFIVVTLASSLTACAVREFDWPSGKPGTARETWTKWDPRWPSRPENLVGIRASRLELSGSVGPSGWEVTGRTGGGHAKVIVKEARVVWNSLNVPEPHAPAIALDRWKIDSPQALLLASARLGTGPYAVDLRQRSRNGSPVWHVQDAASASVLIDAERGVILP